MMNNFVTLKEASKWASFYLKRDIDISNISYLVQYGKVRKYHKNGLALININELRFYYQSYNGKREIEWKEKLGARLNWLLSFDHLRERDTTKHVHRLHPYKGKFIPQLVEYFMDSHLDGLKKDSYFAKGDIILDPFSGSGTTLVQANELGIYSIGIDISKFNCMLAEVKLFEYDLRLVANDIQLILESLSHYVANTKIVDFEQELMSELQKFNSQYFPSPEFKRRVYQAEVNEGEYSLAKERDFLKIYKKLVNKYDITLVKDRDDSFLGKWYMLSVRKEIEFVFAQIKKIKDHKRRKLLAIILSRTMRSCRATTHADLATLKELQLTTYYCWKHKKICKPLFSIKSWFARYTKDTIKRLREFELLRTSVRNLVLAEDSRAVNIEDKIKKNDAILYEIYQRKRIKGIITSPPYVGQINYHEQHAYAYDLFKFNRKDNFEIGSLTKGSGQGAQSVYIKDISRVLINCKKYLAADFNIFLIANDKHKLYPTIAEHSGLIIVNRYKRPVLNRTERDKSPYSEEIFHLKGS